MKITILLATAIFALWSMGAALASCTRLVVPCTHAIFVATIPASCTRLVVPCTHAIFVATILASCTRLVVPCTHAIFVATIPASCGEQLPRDNNNRRLWSTPAYHVVNNFRDQRHLRQQRS